MTRPKIGKCEGCDRRRPIRRIGVRDGRDVYRCGNCVPWGEGVAAIDHEVISADEDGLIADGGERVDREVSQRTKSVDRIQKIAEGRRRFHGRSRNTERGGHPSNLPGVANLYWEAASDKQTSFLHSYPPSIHLIADRGSTTHGDEVARALLEGVGRAAYLRDYCFGIKPGQSGVTWDPIYPYHRAPRECPFCGQIYRRHAGFADQRDNCEEGPNPGANPVSVGGDRA